MHGFICLEKALFLAVHPHILQKKMPFIITRTKLTGDIYSTLADQCILKGIFRSNKVKCTAKEILRIAYDTVAKCEHESSHGIGVTYFHLSHLANSILYYQDEGTVTHQQNISLNCMKGYWASARRQLPAWSFKHSVILSAFSRLESGGHRG